MFTETLSRLRETMQVSLSKSSVSVQNQLIRFGQIPLMTTSAFANPIWLCFQFHRSLCSKERRSEKEILPVFFQKKVRAKIESNLSMESGLTFRGMSLQDSGWRKMLMHCFIL